MVLLKGHSKRCAPYHECNDRNAFLLQKSQTNIIHGLASVQVWSRIVFLPGVRSSGLEFKERTGPSPGSEFGSGEKNLAQHCFAGSEFGERKKLTMVRQVQSSEKGTGRTLDRLARSSKKGTDETLVRQVWKSEKRQGRTLVWQVWSSKKGTGRTLVWQIQTFE